MNYFKKITLIHCFILLSILFLSCSANHHLRNDVIYKDDNFTYDNLKNDGMIIGGISSQLINLTQEQRLKYSSDLFTILLEKLKDAHKNHILNTLQLIDKMGREQYFDMVENFDKEKIVKKETIHLVRDSIPDTKYFLLTYIENENIIDNSFEEYIEDKKEKETHYEKTYLLTIEFQMYDLLQQKMVWNNSIYNEARQTENRTTRTGCVEGCIDNLIQSIFFGEPAEINREEVLAKIVEKFAKDMAKTKN